MSGFGQNPIVGGVAVGPAFGLVFRRTSFTMAPLRYSISIVRGEVERFWRWGAPMSACGPRRGVVFFCE